MKRKKYPSDYRRYFKVKVDILDNPKLEECSADCFRFFIRLLAMLKRANSRDGTITLGRGALNLCAGREQLRHSLRVASEGAEAGLYDMRADGAQTFIAVRNWAEKQEITPTLLPDNSGDTPDSRVRVEKSKSREENTPPKSPPAASPPGGECESRAEKPEPSPKPKPKARHGPKKLRPKPPDWALEVASELRERVTSRLPGAVGTWDPAKAAAWAREISAIEAEPNRIIEAITWLYGPENEPPYRLEVRCGDTLRTKWGQVLAAMNRSDLRPASKAEQFDKIFEETMQRDRDEQQRKRERKLQAC